MKRFTKRQMVRQVLRENPSLTPCQVNQEIGVRYGEALASGWLQIYCREERARLRKKVKK